MLSLSNERIFVDVIYILASCDQHWTIARAAKFGWFKAWRLFAHLVLKKIFRREFFLTTSPPPTPPSPKKFRSVYHFRGKNIFGKDTFPKFDLFFKNFNEYCTTTFLVFLIHTLETSTDFLSKKKTIFSEIEFL